MITEITIKNYKSILSETIPLSNVNVFIGENGCGKTNILEAVAFASCAEENNVNIENLYSKGVRNAKPSLVFSSFAGKKQKDEFYLNFDFSRNLENEKPIVQSYNLKAENKEDFFAKWEVKKRFDYYDTKHDIRFLNMLNKAKKEKGFWSADELLESKVAEFIQELTVNEELRNEFLGRSKVNNLDSTKLENFIIYTLNTKSLRGIYTESKKEPLGINGENLDILLMSFDKEEAEELRKYSRLISWLDDFFIDKENILMLST